MQKSPTFSFIMPLYNAEKWMKVAISSIINQTNSDWEAVLINDGSSDKTWDVLEEFKLNYPNKFVIKTIKNSGPAKARRFGAELSSGEYVLFLDSDDYVSDDYIQQMSNTLASSPSIDMIIPELMSEQKDGSWCSFNKTHNLEQGMLFKGKEAFRRTFPWSIHGFAAYKRSLFLEASEGNLEFNRYNADEYVTRVLLLMCDNIGISGGKYFHKANFFSLTKKISLNKLGLLETERRLINLTVKKDPTYLDQVISDSNRKLFTSIFSFLMQQDKFSKDELKLIVESHRTLWEEIKKMNTKLIDISNSTKFNLLYKLFFNWFNVVYWVVRIKKNKKMRVLLVGEASSLHLNLKKGLLEHNYDVTLFSSGDGFKKIKSDIVIKRGKSNIDKLLYYLHLVLLIAKFKNFDVVQLVSTEVFPFKFGLNKVLIRILKYRNKKLFVIGAGCVDTFTCDFFEDGFRYKEFYRAIKNHYKVDKLWGQTTKGRDFNKWLFRKIDGYIPIMYEYAEGHRRINQNKLKSTIPIPMKLDEFIYEKNLVKDKVIIFHGISRREVKGTDFILEELNKLKEVFSDKVELLIVEKVQYSDYLKLLRKANIVIDQSYSVSSGVNGLIAMALGKIVLGGGEEEFLKEFSLDSSPLVPIGIEKNNIFNTISDLILNPERIESLGLASRLFVENNHDANKIAKKYINVWNEN